MACPVCRTEFQIPNGGLRNLPKNFIVEKLCDANDDDSWEKPKTMHAHNGFKREGMEEKISKTTLNKCSKHPNELADGYCYHCRVNIQQLLIKKFE